MRDPCDSCIHDLDSPHCKECVFNEDNWTLCNRCPYDKDSALCLGNDECPLNP